MQEGKSHFRCFWFLTRTRVYTYAWGVEGATKSDSARLPILIYQQPRQGAPALPRPVSLLFQGHARPFSAPCLSPESGAWGAFPVDLPHPSPELWFQGQCQPPAPVYSRTHGLFQTNPCYFTVNCNCRILLHVCLGRLSVRLEVLNTTLTPLSSALLTMPPKWQALDKYLIRLLSNFFKLRAIFSWSLKNFWSSQCLVIDSIFFISLQRKIIDKCNRNLENSEKGQTLKITNIPNT